jgi:tripartite-type tricarboxylate transporter receptor subunit TctC
MKPIPALMLLFSAILMASDAAAQMNYPEKPIRLIIARPAGSQQDTVARLLGHKLTEAWAKPVLIDNVAGAAGSIAGERVAKAVPDGYTMALLGEGQIVVNPSLYKLAYDTVRDFAPISQVTVSPNTRHTGS